MSRKRRTGHYCWSCGQMRANEKFSGRGHARHLCKDCARLGKEELGYRQAVRDLEWLVTWEGIIPRKKRQQFRKYLEHHDERVRAYARQIEAADVQARTEQRFHQDSDDLLSEPGEEGFVLPETALSPELTPKDDTEIPF